MWALGTLGPQLITQWQRGRKGVRKAKEKRGKERGKERGKKKATKERGAERSKCPTWLVRGKHSLVDRQVPLKSWK